MGDYDYDACRSCQRKQRRDCDVMDSDCAWTVNARSLAPKSTWGPRPPPQQVPQQQPVYAQQPTYGQAYPQQPTYGQAYTQQPTYGQAFPRQPTSGTHPGYIQQQSHLQQPPQSVYGPQPEYRQQPPAYGQQTAYGQQQNFGNRPAPQPESVELVAPTREMNMQTHARATEAARKRRKRQELKDAADGGDQVAIDEREERRLAYNAGRKKR
ncbi:hypothetical protein LTR09_002972 [Extremus antarcticus]|uniref:Uncharacterized protein n=1 Tax=Extremus antarcticus TaxID=702011 RepID=A0AAJ0LV99_9PEZI|nr:hypothetical protein LTR09_002972 [Extremus antarcticus]